MAFEQPAAASKFSPRDNPLWWTPPKLFLIYPTSVEDVQFEDGPSKIVTADIAIIDLPDAEKGTSYTLMLGARVGGKALVPQLSPYVGTGKASLGRLTQLPAQGSKSGAFKLNNFTDQDAAAATAFEAQNANWRGVIAQPAAVPPVAPQSPSAYSAAPTPPPAPVAAPAAAGSPWYSDPANGALVATLAAKGVPFTMLPDLATAQLAAGG